MGWIRLLIGCALTLAAAPQGTECVYYGKFLGELRTMAHRVSGRVYVASEDSLYLVGFHYDGGGPDAFFWLSPRQEPSDDGIIVPDENGSRIPLGRYDNQTVLITLPEGKITDHGSFAVWCRKFSANFGHVEIPSDFELPAEQTIGTFVNGAHGIRSGPVTLLDSQTVHIARFYYDGAGPDAYFMVGSGPEITHVGATKVPNENGSTEKLGRYEGKDLFLTLPGGVDWGDVRWLSVYCVRAVTSLASIRIPDPTALSIPVKLGARSTASPSSDPQEPNTMLVLSEGTERYLGKQIGQLEATTHGVSGTVHAARDNAIVLEDFSYDGSGPDAFFMVGNSNAPSDKGTVLPNEAGSMAKLSSYSKKTLVLTLPAGKIITNYKWFSVYCRQAKQSFGHVTIPSNLDYPKELVLGTSLTGAHNTRVNSVILKDAKTLLLSKFGYDGSAPDAYFLAGKGKPNGQGTKIPDEKGSLSRLRGYSNVDLTLTLPGDTTAFDVDWFSVYCIRFSENFFSVTIPSNPNVPPDLAALTTNNNMEFDNCEAIFPDKLQVSWKMDGSQIFFHLRARTMQGEWASFGISGNRDRHQMVGGDVAVAYYDETQGKVVLRDFYLESKAQCSTNGGVCPDEERGGTDNLKMWSSSYTNGILQVVYSRPLAAGDNFDKNIPGSGEVAIIAAFGPMNNDKVVLFHTKYYIKSDVKLAFSRPPVQNCMAFGDKTGISEDDTKVFAARKIKGVTHFTAQIGPTGGSKGYEKITGSSGWGISWWINGQLIPVLYVERGTTYTFVPEGGHDPSNSARYHPFYITDSPKGGGTKEDPDVLGKPGHLLLAGVVMGADGRPDVTSAIGRFCEWEHKDVDQSDNVETFDEFKKTLVLKCESGYPQGKFTWTPDENTPDTVYYQCFTHFYLGWKIKVRNPGQADDDDDDEGHKNKHGGGNMGGTASLVMAALFVPLTSFLILADV